MVRKKFCPKLPRVNFSSFQESGYACEPCSKQREHSLPCQQVAVIAGIPPELD